MLDLRLPTHGFYVAQGGAHMLISGSRTLSSQRQSPALTGLRSITRTNKIAIKTLRIRGGKRLMVRQSIDGPPQYRLLGRTGTDGPHPLL